MAHHNVKEVTIIMFYQNDEGDDAERTSNATLLYGNSLGTNFM